MGVLRKPTQTDFALDALIELYIQRLCGLSYSRRNKQDLPTYVVYQEIMEILDGTYAGEYGKELAQKYKDKIIGKTALKTAPSRYFEIGAVIDMGIEPPVWESYDIHWRAEIMARRYVKNMIEVIDAYYKDQDDLKEKGNKGKPQNDSAGANNA